MALHVWYYFRVKVPKRQMAQRQKLIGIDIGAKVLRGPNWRWADQDGKLLQKYEQELVRGDNWGQANQDGKLLQKYEQESKL